jgi:hypothetical protein
MNYRIVERMTENFNPTQSSVFFSNEDTEASNFLKVMRIQWKSWDAVPSSQPLVQLCSTPSRFLSELSTGGDNIKLEQRNMAHILQQEN